MAEEREETDVDLAERLFAERDEGRGTAKSELERRTWGDGSSHGRRLDRFVRQQIGVSTTKRSRQTDRISDLEQQVRSLGSHLTGVEPTEPEIQLQHGRAACLGALHVWNDPDAGFRTGGFSEVPVARLIAAALELADVAERPAAAHSCLLLPDVLGTKPGGDPVH